MAKQTLKPAASPANPTPSAPAPANRFLRSCRGWLAGAGLAGAALFAAPAAAQSVNLILDTDIGTDCDDAGAFAAMHAMADRGEVRILAIGVVNGHPDAVRAVDAINTWYGRPNLPVGVIKSGAPFSIDDYVGGVAREFPHDLTKDKAPEVVGLYRKILAAQPDNSVTLVAIGPATNISRLLDSGADSHSSLSGVELVRRKVKFYSAGGNGAKGLPAGLAGYNYRCDLASASNELAKMPTNFPTVFAGGSGWDIKIGNALKQKPSNHPIRRAYEHYLGAGNNLDRAAIDAMRVVYAVRPQSRSKWDYLTGAGHVYLKGETIYYTSSTNNNRAFAYANSNNNRWAIHNEIEALMLQNPARNDNNPPPPPPPSVTAPSISQQPASQTVSVGSTVTFSVSASGSPAPTFQWRKGGSNIAGATSASFTIGSVSSSDAASYSVVVKNSVGTVTSNGATLTVTTSGNGGGSSGKHTGTVISSSPYGGSSSYSGSKAFDGSSSSFFAGNPSDKLVHVGLDLGSAKSVSKVRFVPRSGYAWRMSGGQFRGANKADLSDAVTLATVSGTPSASWNELTVGTGASFRYVFFTTSSSLEANIAELEFHGSGGTTGGGTAPQITSQPQSVTVIEGDPVTFRVSTSATNASFQWRRNGVAIAGATSDTHHIKVVLGEDAGAYSVVVTANGQSVTSGNATLTVNAIGGDTGTGKLSGTAIGSAPYGGSSSYAAAKAFDGSSSSFFAGAPSAKLVYVGLDLGSAKSIAKLRFVPRSGFAWRMSGGQFRGANKADLSDAVTLATVSGSPSASWNELTVSNGSAFRYVFFTTSSANEANIAELEIHGGSSTPPPPPSTGGALSGTAIGSTPYNGSSSYGAAKAFDGSASSFFAGSPSAKLVHVGLDLGSAKAIGKVRFQPRSGFAYRMVGGQFRGANRADLSDAVTLATVSSTPSAGWNEVSVNNTAGYRYVFFTTSAHNEANVAELQFHAR